MTNEFFFILRYVRLTPLSKLHESYFGTDLVILDHSIPLRHTPDSRDKNLRFAVWIVVPRIFIESRLDSVKAASSALRKKEKITKYQQNINTKNCYMSYIGNFNEAASQQLLSPLPLVVVNMIKG
ncbi:hypothetical protein AVEN_239681-1 [Araneus ventricosus]|uniref:Uncharacterized protein n=1 Tax=Araneus ventricosus TaxID=182803 RepID=A0A4Y2CRA4_ARAVE|nr:hypothetical protein AVEN_239681-1 [Araneus ventricosus]